MLAGINRGTEQVEPSGFVVVVGGRGDESASIAANFRPPA